MLIGEFLSRKQAQFRGQPPAQRTYGPAGEQKSEFRSWSDWLLAKPVLHVRKTADVCDRACAINIAAHFLRISFAHENAALPPKRAVSDALGDLARRAVVVTNLVSRI